MPILVFDRSAVGRGTLCLVLALVAVVLFWSPAPAPAAGDGPEVEAKAWLLIDAADGTTLAAKAPGRSLPIASATKMMSVYVALQRLDLDEELVAADYDPLPVESVLGLQSGERMEVRDLITAMMLPSANDAAVTVAEGAAGSRERFVELMNRAARQLGLDDSSFANPIGLDDPNNFSSARDLVDLGLELRKNPFFRKTVAKTSATLRSGDKVRQVETRNTLALSDSRVDGIKTGHTNGAGYVLVASAKQDGTRLISVVLGTASEAARDSETERLLDYGFSLYRDKTAIERREVLGSVPVEGDDQPLRVISGRGLKVRLRRDQQPEVSLELPEQISDAVSAGERLGRAEVLVEGEAVGVVPLLATRAVAEPGGLVDDAGNLLAVALIGGGAMVLLAATGIAINRSRRVRGRETKVRDSQRDEEQRESSRRQRELRRNGEGSAR